MVLKILSRAFIVALALVLFSTNCLLAYSPEINLWKHRKQAILSQSISPTSPVLSSHSFQKIPEAKKIPSMFSKPAHPLLPHLNNQFGSVRKVEVRNNSQLIIHIQDVHLNPEAQANMGKALQQLIDQKLVDLVALEGDFSEINLNRYRQFGHFDTVRKVADYLFRIKKISGPIHSLLTSAVSIPPVVGVDDSVAYKANVQAYLDSTKLTEGTSEVIKKREFELAKLKNQFFSPELKKLDSLVQAFRNKEIKLGQYLKSLDQWSDLFSLNRQIFLEALLLEETMDFGQVEAERAQIIHHLSKKLSPQNMSTLFEASSSFRSGQITHVDFYLFLKDLCLQNKIALKNYPALNQYLQYVILSDRVNIDGLLSDLINLERDAFRRIVRTKKQKNIVNESRLLFLTEKLIKFELTPQEWDDYKVLSEKIDQAINLKTFEDFYRQAEIRDLAIVSNLKSAISKHKAKTTVLVTGGFHAHGIHRQLRDSSLISFVPKITKLEIGEGSKYLSVFSEKKTPLEKMFKGDQLFTAPKPITTALSILPLMAAVFRKVRFRPNGARFNKEEILSNLERRYPEGVSIETEPTGKGARATVRTADNKLVTVPVQLNEDVPVEEAPIILGHQEEAQSVEPDKRMSLFRLPEKYKKFTEPYERGIAPGWESAFLIGVPVTLFPVIPFIPWTHFLNFLSLHSPLVLMSGVLLYSVLIFGWGYYLAVYWFEILHKERENPRDVDWGPIAAHMISWIGSTLYGVFSVFSHLPKPTGYFQQIWGSTVDLGLPDLLWEMAIAYTLLHVAFHYIWNNTHESNRRMSLFSPARGEGKKISFTHWDGRRVWVLVEGGKESRIRERFYEITNSHFEIEKIGEWAFVVDNILFHSAKNVDTAGATMLEIARRFDVPTFDPVYSLSRFDREKLWGFFKKIGEYENVVFYTSEIGHQNIIKSLLNQGFWVESEEPPRIIPSTILYILSGRWALGLFLGMPLESFALWLIREGPQHLFPESAPIFWMAHAALFLFIVWFSYFHVKKAKASNNPNINRGSPVLQFLGHLFVFQFYLYLPFYVAAPIHFIADAFLIRFSLMNVDRRISEKINSYQQNPSTVSLIKLLIVANRVANEKKLKDREEEIVGALLNKHVTNLKNELESGEIMARSDLEVISSLFSKLNRRSYEGAYGDKYRARNLDDIEDVDQRALDQMALKFHERNVESILDLEAGTGEQAAFMSKRGFEVDAVETSPSFNEKLIERKNEGHINEVYNLDMTNLAGVPSRSYDAVHSQASLIHFLDGGEFVGADMVVNEANRVLKNGGIAHFFVMQGEGLWMDSTGRLFQLHDEESLTKLLEKNDFNVLEMKLAFRPAGTRSSWIQVYAEKQASDNAEVSDVVVSPEVKTTSQPNFGTAPEPMPTHLWKERFSPIAMVATFILGAPIIYIFYLVIEGKFPGQSIDPMFASLVAGISVLMVSFSIFMSDSKFIRRFDYWKRFIVAILVGGILSSVIFWRGSINSWQANPTPMSPVSSVEVQEAGLPDRINQVLDGSQLNQGLAELSVDGIAFSQSLVADKDVAFPVNNVTSDVVKLTKRLLLSVSGGQKIIVVVKNSDQQIKLWDEMGEFENRERLFIVHDETKAILNQDNVLDVDLFEEILEKNWTMDWDNVVTIRSPGMKIKASSLRNPILKEIFWIELKSWLQGVVETPQRFLQKIKAARATMVSA